MPGKSKKHGCHRINERRAKSKPAKRLNKKNAQVHREARNKALDEAKLKFLGNPAEKPKTPPKAQNTPKQKPSEPTEEKSPPPPKEIETPKTDSPANETSQLNLPLKKR